MEDASQSDRDSLQTIDFRMFNTKLFEDAHKRALKLSVNPPWHRGTDKVAQTVDLDLVKGLQICRNSTLTASQALVNKVSKWWYIGGLKKSCLRTGGEQTALDQTRVKSKVC
ncbi:hypothetical protein F2P79_003541 [Pimephales promelas]|nr:hypothetical protein F2P79_003541 [Pimephales promelas]